MPTSSQGRPETYYHQYSIKSYRSITRASNSHHHLLSPPPPPIRVYSIKLLYLLSKYSNTNLTSILLGCSMRSGLFSSTSGTRLEPFGVSLLIDRLWLRTMYLRVYGKDKKIGKREGLLGVRRVGDARYRCGSTTSTTTVTAVTFYRRIIILLLTTTANLPLPLPTSTDYYSLVAITIKQSHTIK